MEIRILNSCRLIKESLKLLLLDKEMLFFPLLSLLGTVAALALWYPLIDLSKLSEDKPPPIEFLWQYLVFYFVVVFISTLSKAGVIALAHERMLGHDPTFGTGIRRIKANFPRIAAWALFAASIGFLLEMLKERGNFILRLFWSGVEIMWGLVSLIALPIVVIEESSMGEGLTRAQALFNKTWGENIIGQISLEFLAIPMILLTVVLFYLASFLPSQSLRIFGSVVALCPIPMAIILVDALNGIFSVALYHYASTGEAPAHFSEDLISGAFAQN